MVRKFLWVVTGLVLIACAIALSYRLFAPQLMRAAFVPDLAFRPDPAPIPDYSRADMWIAHPHLRADPARWTPPGIAPNTAARVSVFFVHPTSLLDKSRWNARLGDAETEDRARLFVRSQASVFNGVGAIWAPKYRQATAGAFLTDRKDARQALDLAYRDVRAAFEEFLREAPADRPIILAAHSQGSFHLSRLMTEYVAGKPLARRIAAVYLVGWPLSTTIDLPRLGLPACARAGDNGCILAWQSFAEPADPSQLLDIYAASVGPNDQSRAGTPILCVNPITGNTGDVAPAAANAGTLVPNVKMTEATLRLALVPARCDSRGLLLIGDTPLELPPFVLPGNNYHVFDYSLFWSNVRADVARRLATFEP